jgi:hypothetical protein
MAGRSGESKQGRRRKELKTCGLQKPETRQPDEKVEPHGESGNSGKPLVHKNVSSA